MIRWVLLACLGWAACERPEVAPIPEDLYVKLLGEAALVRAVYETTLDTALTSALFLQALDANGVRPGQFDSAHAVYMMDVDGQKARWSRVLDDLRLVEQRLAEEKVRLSQRDTIP